MAYNKAWPIPNQNKSIKCYYWQDVPVLVLQQMRVPAYGLWFKRMVV